jgi:hypothetical protein
MRSWTPCRLAARNGRSWRGSPSHLTMPPTGRRGSARPPWNFGGPRDAPRNPPKFEGTGISNACSNRLLKCLPHHLEPVNDGSTGSTTPSGGFDSLWSPHLHPMLLPPCLRHPSDVVRNYLLRMFSHFNQRGISRRAGATDFLRSWTASDNCRASMPPLAGISNHRLDTRHLVQIRRRGFATDVITDSPAS